VSLDVARRETEEALNKSDGESSWAMGVGRPKKIAHELRIFFDGVAEVNLELSHYEK
jgi:hypothetical protein